MPEVEFARQTLTFVQFFLLMGVTHEWFHRALINRLYYAGHHLGRRLLIEAGLQPEQWRQNIHRRVLEELERHYVAAGRMSREALDALSELRILRVLLIMTYHGKFVCEMSVALWRFSANSPMSAFVFWGELRCWCKMKC